VFKDYRPPKDAFVIDKLRKAGRDHLGKATLSEFAAGDTYDRSSASRATPMTSSAPSADRPAARRSAGGEFLDRHDWRGTLASIRGRRPGTRWSACGRRPGLVSRTGMWDGYPTCTPRWGPMARTVRDLAKLLDGMVGYDPEDPVTALGVGKVEGSYTRYLDQGALNGARIGILRESIREPV